ncbi:hypothetical protein VKT23_000597 [Stygiomarasmius scandens]|uniref:Uncharacterized protein n=1 Tax=Marasmiellus scandens TaxID=2682957 RepID=A0ABR1K5K0_9AGAR
MFVPTSTLDQLEIYIRQESSTSTGSTSSSTSASTTTTSRSSSSTSSSTSESSSSASLSSSLSSGSASSTTSSISSSSSSSSTSRSSASASPTGSPSSSSNKAKLVGGIVGGVIGGLIVFILLSVLFSAWRRRRNDARKRPRGSVFFDAKKVKKEGDDEALNQFLSSPSLNPRTVSNHTESMTSVPLLSVPFNDGHRGTEHDNSSSTSRTATPTNLEEERRLRSPYSVDEGHRDDEFGHNPENSSTSLPMPSPYSEHGHGHFMDENDFNVSELAMPTPVFAAASRGNDFRRMSLVRSDFSLAALEAATTPKSLSPNLDPVSVGPSEAIPSSASLPVAALGESEVGGLAVSKPVTSTDELHNTAASSNTQGTTHAAS